MRFLLVVMLGVSYVLVGCGQLECSKEDRTGTYLLTSIEVSGSCGHVRSSVAILTDGTPVIEDGCFVEFERWSDNECTLERNVTCVNETDNIIVTGSGISTQDDYDGEIITGIMSIEARNLHTNAWICASTYEVVFERQ